MKFSAQHNKERSRWVEPRLDRDFEISASSVRLQLSSRLWKAVLLSKGFATPPRSIVPPPRLAGRSRVPAAQEVGGAQANARDQQHAYLRGNEVPVEHAHDLEV